MGYMTFEEMTQEVVLNLGGKVTDPVRLLAWVNWAVQNIASHVTLDELITTAAFTISEDATSFTAPTDMLGVIHLTCWDATLSLTTGERVYQTLKKMKREFYPRVEQKQPTHYKRRGLNIITWPEADTEYTGEIEYVKVPAQATALTGTSEFAAFWDVGLVMLATHYGWTALRQHDEADRWLGRFLGYKSSRILEQDVSADMPQGGINVAWTPEDVTDTPPHFED